MSTSKSKYAEKVATKSQMYGPGCCAHKLTRQQMDAIQQRKRTDHGPLLAAVDELTQIRT